MRVLRASPLIPRPRIHRRQVADLQSHAAIVIVKPHLERLVLIELLIFPSRSVKVTIQLRTQSPCETPRYKNRVGRFYRAPHPQEFLPSVPHPATLHLLDKAFKAWCVTKTTFDKKKRFCERMLGRLCEPHMPSLDVLLNVRCLSQSGCVCIAIYLRYAFSLHMNCKIDMITIEYESCTI